MLCSLVLFMVMVGLCRIGSWKVGVGLLISVDGSILWLGVLDFIMLYIIRFSSLKKNSMLIMIVIGGSGWDGVG